MVLILSAELTLGGAAAGGGAVAPTRARFG